MISVPKHEGFDKIVGQWKTEGVILKAGEPNQSLAGSNIYEGLPEGYFVIHRIDVMIDREHIQEVEIIGPFDLTKSTFPMRTFGARGAYAEMTGRFDSDGALIADDEQTRMRMAVSENRSGMKARWGRRDDEGKWMPWLDVRFSKVE